MRVDAIRTAPRNWRCRGGPIAPLAAGPGLHAIRVPTAISCGASSRAASSRHNCVVGALQGPAGPGRFRTSRSTPKKEPILSHHGILRKPNSIKPSAPAETIEPDSADRRN